jgi:hypothetical protein
MCLGVLAFVHVPVRECVMRECVRQTLWTNFSPMGYSGADLYAWDGLEWRWVATVEGGLSAAAAARSTLVLESPLFVNTNASVSRYRLHFPSYNGVLTMSIGVPAGSAIAGDAASWNASAPVLYVGTSITQGGLTARPGLAYVNRLSGRLRTPVTNLGFCGSCRLEAGFAKWVAAAAVPPALVLDCTANMSPEEVASNTVPFVVAIRAAPGWAKVRRSVRARAARADRAGALCCAHAREHAHSM